jgi:hypothetical protein
MFGFCVFEERGLSRPIDPAYISLLGLEREKPDTLSGVFGAKYLIPQGSSFAKPDSLSGFQQRVAGFKLRNVGMSARRCTQKCVRDGKKLSDIGTGGHYVHSTGKAAGES